MWLSGDAQDVSGDGHRKSRSGCPDCGVGLWKRYSNWSWSRTHRNQMATRQATPHAMAITESERGVLLHRLSPSSSLAVLRPVSLNPRASNAFGQGKAKGWCWCGWSQLVLFMACNSVGKFVKLAMQNMQNGMTIRNMQHWQNQQ